MINLDCHFGTSVVSTASGKALDTLYTRSWLGPPYHRLLVPLVLLERPTGSNPQVNLFYPRLPKHNIDINI